MNPKDFLQFLKLIGLLTQVPNKPMVENYPPIVPAMQLMGAPKKENVQLSPDGQFVSYLADANIWLIPTSLIRDGSETPRGSPVLKDADRGAIKEYFWTLNPQTIVFTRDRDGDERFQIFLVDLEKKTIEPLTPSNYQSVFFATGAGKPEEIAIGTAQRDERHHDPFIYNLRTGQRRLLAINDRFGSFLRLPTFVFDNNMKLRLGQAMDDFGNVAWMEDINGTWSLYRSVDTDDALTTKPLKFSSDGSKLYWLDNVDRDLVALTEMDFQTKLSQVLYQPQKADVQSVVFDPRTNTPAIVVENYEKEELFALTKDVGDDVRFLKRQGEGEPQVLSTSADFNLWIVSYINDVNPPMFYLFRRQPRSLQFLFVEHQMPKFTPAPMHWMKVKTRDGLTELCYYSLPPETDPNYSGKPTSPQPTVMFIHGGPWLRENWGYNQIAQWCTNRGYVFLDCMFRGSTGFGKNYLNAAAEEWGRKMQFDLLDGIKEAVNQRITDGNQVAALGGSYGGFAVLAGLTFSPDIFTCGVEMFGPSDIVSTHQSDESWAYHRKGMYKKLVGDFESPEGQAFLRTRSPLYYVDRIKVPLMVAQGANDPRVSQRESDQIVKAMKTKGLPVTYILFPDEGHGFHGMNMMAFTSVAELFIKNCLGGRAEPLGQMRGSSIQVIEEGDLPELLPWKVNKTTRG